MRWAGAFQEHDAGAPPLCTLGIRGQQVTSHLVSSTLVTYSYKSALRVHEAHKLNKAGVRGAPPVFSLTMLWSLSGPLPILPP